MARCFNFTPETSRLAWTDTYRQADSASSDSHTQQHLMLIKPILAACVYMQFLRRKYPFRGEAIGRGSRSPL